MPPSHTEGGRVKEESVSDPLDPSPPPEGHHRRKPWHLRANLMAGVLTAIPAIIVWTVSW